MPRDAGAWARDKLKILDLYLQGYLQATTSALERVYVDAFSGPGTNRLSGTDTIFDGSPLIALNATAQNGTTFDRLFFIEKDPRVLEELQTTVSSRGLEARVTFICGDVNVELPRVVHQLPRRSPTFVFIDPEGIDPEWTTIRGIAPWRTELMINFPFGMAIKRNPTSPKVSAYFGTDAWQDTWRLPGPAPTRALLDLYKGRLKELGYKYSPDHDRLVRTERNQKLYYLLFVSKVKVAETIMKWVFEQPDAAGQTRMPL